MPYNDVIKIDLTSFDDGSLNKTYQQLVQIQTILGQIKSTRIAPIKVTGARGATPAAAGVAAPAQAGLVGPTGLPISTQQANEATQAQERLATATQKVGGAVKTAAVDTSRFGQVIQTTTTSSGDLIKTFRGADGTMTKFNVTQNKVAGSTKKMQWGFMGISQTLPQVFCQVCNLVNYCWCDLWGG